ncbi:thioredoxin TrxC [Motilimonas eburnea]|uniref:thioredoxin TrxC n=1 Tax=Motilimonas eburnea TaxID=1737488 RepID=UPI001E34080C|nr:thioredoxin TrxC [Motilimonas eburnea]MCE2570493.1 thioredoxin TrxC [Motilimonas eburnea]
MTSTIIRCPHCAANNRIDNQKLVDHPKCGKCKKSLLFGAPIEATQDNFNALIHSGLTVVVDFWASWCGPCMQFAPTFKAAAAEFGQKVVFVKVNTEEQTALSSEYRIRSIPTLMIFQSGAIRQQLAGALPPSQFNQWLAQNS